MFKEIRQNGRSIVKVMKNGSIIWQKPNPGILPAGYIECEYLESADEHVAFGGDATLTYIDTGISFVYGDYIHVKSQLLGSMVDDAFAVSHYPWSGPRMAIGGQYHTRFTFGVAHTGTSSSVDLKSDNNVHDFELKLRSNDITQYRYDAYVDNVYYTAYDWSVSSHATSTNQLRLFVGYAYEQCRIYMFEMKDQSGNHKINLIPCLDNLGVPCMYDTVSKTTFYNQGTGTFGYKVKGSTYYNWDYQKVFIDRQGTTISHSAGMLTDYIPYSSPGYNYYVGCDNPSANNIAIIMYDSDKNAIDYWTSSYTFEINGKTYTGSNRVRTASAAYMRICTTISNYENVIIYDPKTDVILWKGSDHPPDPNYL